MGSAKLVVMLSLKVCKIMIFVSYTPSLVEPEFCLTRRVDWILV
jgi:hypothetical protein